MRKGWLLRAAGIGMLSIAAAAATIEVVAAVRVRRRRAERAYLGDREGTENGFSTVIPP